MTFSTGPRDRRRRFDIAPLLELIAPRVLAGDRLPVVAGKYAAPTLGEYAAVLGVSDQTVRRYRDRGMDALRADRMAVSAGYHPIEVWPDFHDDKRLRRNERERQRYRTDAAKRARRIETRRAYYAENADYERARERRRYAARKVA